MIAVAICRQPWLIPETTDREFPLRGIASLKIQQIRCRAAAREGFGNPANKDRPKAVRYARHALSWQGFGSSRAAGGAALTISIGR